MFSERKRISITAAIKNLLEMLIKHCISIECERSGIIINRVPIIPAPFAVPTTDQLLPSFKLL